MAQVVDIFMVPSGTFAARLDDGEVRCLSNRETASILRQAGAPVSESLPVRTVAAIRRIVRITATRVTVTTRLPAAGQLAA